MPSTKKTDNNCLDLKLALRRHFMAGLKNPSVLDCCAGNEEIWRRLGPCRYVPLDVKRARGRLAVLSERIVEIEGMTADVVDIDTYGLPWKHYLPLLKWKQDRLVVFLTFAFLLTAGSGGRPLTKEIRESLGIGSLELAPAFTLRICHAFLFEMIGQAWRHGWKIEECLEAVAFEPGNARYFGLRLRR